MTPSPWSSSVVDATAEPEVGADPGDPGTTPVFVTGLSRHGSRPALHTDRGWLTYAELAAEVDSRRETLGRLSEGSRALVHLVPRTDLDFVADYLAALAGEHTVLVGDQAMADDYRATVTSAGAGFARTAPASQPTPPTLHRDLRLLLSTSGSTGSPKLVRLSATNLDSNAAAIADYLGLAAEDRAITSLPFDYCYGLSVLHSHLLAGAGLVLSPYSVTDPMWWSQAHEQAITSFAGVPYTFELLDRAGWQAPRSLRRVTQAGGRMRPEAVRRYAERGLHEGWDFVVMYGQTEATARMSYLEPHLAASHPTSIGRPIPGGRFRIDPVDGVAAPAGELVYTGPNVMMGYAERPEDLARPAELDELRTGDLARQDPETGLFEILGRRARFAKLFGQRLDLGRIEATLADNGFLVACAESAGATGLVVAVVAASPADTGDDTGDGTAEARRHLLRLTGLPAHALAVVPVAQLPRVGSGKVDFVAVAAMKERRLTDSGIGVEAALCADYVDVLGLDGVTSSDTFCALGGDSLSYVELSVRLEDRLGRTPTDWASLPIAALAERSPSESDSTELDVRRSRGWVRLDTGVALRAVGILLIVGSHTNLFTLLGAAHVLLAVAGYNFARFQLGVLDPRDRFAAVMRTAARIAVPAVIWIGAAAVVLGDYSWRTVILGNQLLGAATWSSDWHFWFLEVLLYLLLGSAALLAIGPVARLERRHRYGFALALLAVTMLGRLAAATEPDRDVVHTVWFVGWYFVGGWAAAVATRHRQRLLVIGLLALGTVGLFDDPLRESLIVGGLALLVMCPTVHWPWVLSRSARVLAASSLYIYLTHWQIYPHLEHRWPLAGLVLSVAVGIAAWQVSDRTAAQLARRRTPP